MAELFIAYMVGAFFGIFFATLIYNKYHKPVGVLHIDGESIPDEPPYFFLELDENASDISKMEYATFYVANETYLPQE